MSTELSQKNAVNASLGTTILGSSIRGKPIAHLAWLAAALLFFSSSTALAKTKDPEWYIQAEPDTKTTIYGVGKGQSLDAAKQGALKDISSKLLVSVESQSVASTVVDGDQIEEKFKEVIRTNVQTLGLSGYEVNKSHKKGKHYWVQVSIELAKLFQTTKAKLDPSLLELKAYFNKKDSITALQAKADAPRLKALIDQSRGQLFIMSAAKSTFDGLRELKQLASYESILTEKQNGLLVYVSSSSQLSYLAKKVVDALNREGFPATTVKPGAQKKYMKLELAGTFKDSQRIGQNFSALALTVTAYDELQTLITQREFNLFATSISSYSAAKQSLANKFSDDLELDGAALTLGLEE